MKKKGLKILATVLLTLALFLNIDIVFKKETTSYLKFGAVSGVFASSSGSGSAPSGCSDCNKSGGRGATSCECELANAITGTTKCSVSVSTGYYACCRRTTLGDCKCLSCPN
jgi:hypothetical protein